jgi:hypothetical protein
MLSSLIRECIRTNLRIDSADAIGHDQRSGFQPYSAGGHLACRIHRKAGSLLAETGWEAYLPLMKSAYELAMERLEKASPSVALTEDQKKEIADVDSLYRAKIAERELFLKNQISKAQNAGNLDEVESLEKQLASDVRRLQEDCEAKKEKLRASFAKSL